MTADYTPMSLIFYIDEQMPLSAGHDQPSRSTEHFATFERAVQCAREVAERVLRSYGDDELFFEEIRFESRFQLALVAESNGTPFYVINVRQSRLVQ